MTHQQSLQMLARSRVAPSCASIARLAVDCRPSSVAAEITGGPRNSSQISIPSAVPDCRSCSAAAGINASAAVTWRAVSPGGSRGGGNTPSPGVPRSVSSFSCRGSRSDAVQLGSLFLPRFPRGQRGNVLARKFVLRHYIGSDPCRSKLNLGGPSAGGFRVSSGQVGAGERLDLFSRSFGSSSARRVAVRSSASSAAPVQGPQNFVSDLWAKIFAICASFATRLQSIRIGWLDLLTMLRLVLLAAGAVGTYVASKKVWVMIKKKAAGKPLTEGEGEGGGGGDEEQGGGGPMQVLARGATCVQSNMGPWSMADMTIGLTAIAKLTEKKPPKQPGKGVTDLSKDPQFLLKAQHWRCLSEAVYAKDSASFSLFSNLAESSIVAACWEPNQDTFRPAYAVFVDAPFGAVVLAVRGTSHVIDMLLNTGTSPEPFGGEGNYAHGGFVHASKMLYEEVLPHIEKAFKDHGTNQKDLKLVVVGHSLGAAVGTLTAVTLREHYPDLQCWGFSPPACMSMDLAKECKSFTTSFVAGHDLVPRFSLHSVEKLRTRIQEFDWDEVEKVASDDEDWQNIKKGMDTFKSLQEAHKGTIEKLTGGGGGEGEGEGESEIAKKAKELGSKALGTETGGMVDGMAQSIGLQGKDLLGIESPKGEQDCKNEDGEEEECGPPPSLHPPGRLLVMACDPPGCGKMPESRKGVASERGYGSYPTFDEVKNITWHMSEAEQVDMEEIVVSPWCISDHMLGNMAEAISYFQSSAPPAVK